MDYSSYLVTALYGAYSVPCAIYPLKEVRKCTLNYFHDTDNPINIYGNSGTLSHFLHDTDDPTNIYGTSGKLCHILSVTMMIKRTNMVDPGYYRELCVRQELVRYDFRFYCLYS